MADYDPYSSAEDALPTQLPQIEINPSAIRTLLLMLIRVVAIVATAFGSIVAFLKTRDLVGLVNWIKSEEFVQVLTALGLLVSFGSSVWVTLARKWREVYLGRHVKDEIAIVKDATPAPSVEAIIPPAA
jgi:hypothetical protein